MNIKPGTIVYYIRDTGEKIYCKCVAVTSLPNFPGSKQVWGKWGECLEEVKKCPVIHEPFRVENGEYQYMKIEDVFVYRQTLSQLLLEV